MNAFHWLGAPSFATLPENHQFHTRKFKQFNSDMRERPDTTPDWETFRDQEKIVYKKYPKQKDRVPANMETAAERKFNAAMKALAVKANQFKPEPVKYFQDSINTETTAPADKTHSIQRGGI